MLDPVICRTWQQVLDHSLQYSGLLDMRFLQYTERPILSLSDVRS